MKRISKSSKKRINNKTNKRKRSLSLYYHTGGREIPPEWKQTGYKTEADYLEYQREREMARVAMERERAAMIERRKRAIKLVLQNVFIQSIMMLIMNREQSEIFKAYIRENTRIVNDREIFNQMIDEFVNFALTNLLDDEQRLETNRILDAVQQERTARALSNQQPPGPLEILDIIERVARENNDQVARTGGNGKKYYKRFTRKNK
jgi:hypothetical protein